MRENAAPIRLLVVEDDFESAQGLEFMLKRRGIDVTTVPGGEEALSTFDPSRFDAIVADIRLGGMSGVDLLRRIRERETDFPIILLTAYDSLDSAIQAVKFGAQDYILKPLDDIDDLLTPVRKAVRAYRLLMDNRELAADLQCTVEQLHALNARLQSVREEERADISRRIHDDLGHALTGLKMDLSWIQKAVTPGSDPALQTRLGDMSDLLDDAIEKVRQIATTLRPGVLDHLGLGAAIEWQAQDIEKRTGLTCDISLATDGTNLSNEQRTGLFRIFQETLTNIIRHAEASTVTIELQQTDDHVVLEVRDDGCGITKTQTDAPLSLGLLGMREGARALRGEFAIVGKRGKGTRVTTRIPLLGDPTEDKETGGTS
jgi:signal transduction histidine kinase